MAPTSRTPMQVIDDAITDCGGTVEYPMSVVGAVRDALDDEGWIRTPKERRDYLKANAPVYTVADIRNGTGFHPAARFALVVE